MTAELLVMNKTAVALAADSAITLTRESKKNTYRNIYNTASKLFSLSDHCPVGIMFNGAAELNGVPWETIIKIYKNSFFKNRQPTLKDYANDFIVFLNNVSSPLYSSLFPESQQQLSFTSLVYIAFYQIAKKIDITAKDRDMGDDAVKDEIAKEWIKRYHDILKECADLNGATAVFGQETAEKYKEGIELCKDDLFKDYTISDESANQLREISAKLVYKDKFINPSGIVIAGFGENDVFPSYASFTVDAVLNNKLKYKQDDFINIDHINKRAYITTFAQDKTVTTFLQGIDPAYENEIHSYMRNILTKSYPNKVVENLGRIKKSKKADIEAKLRIAGENMLNDFKSKSSDYCLKYHLNPMIQALETLSKDELAKVAESLVNLESFKKRMSLEDETVGGACDVAIISKGDGFIWIKRKHYFEQELNPHHIAKFYKQ
jgi:hypothetical protein